MASAPPRTIRRNMACDGFRVMALKDVTMCIDKSEFVAPMRPSGSGKPTLLHLVAAMEKPSHGEIRILGVDLSSLDHRGIALWRNVHIGFVFQSFNLIQVLTAIEKRSTHSETDRFEQRQRLEHAEAALVGLEHRTHLFPLQVSGGQEQTVVIARALATDPNLTLADELLDVAAADDALSAFPAEPAVRPDRCDGHTGSPCRKFRRANITSKKENSWLPRAAMFEG